MLPEWSRKLIWRNILSIFISAAIFSKNYIIMCLNLFKNLRIGVKMIEKYKIFVCEIFESLVYILWSIIIIIVRKRYLAENYYL